MLKPTKAENQSKHVWLSFYNGEAKKALNEYLSSRKYSDPRLFPISKRHVSAYSKKSKKLLESG